MDPPGECWENYIWISAVRTAFSFYKRCPGQRAQLCLRANVSANPQKLGKLFNNLKKRATKKSCCTADLNVHNLEICSVRLVCWLSIYTVECNEQWTWLYCIWPHDPERLERTVKRRRRAEAPWDSDPLKLRLQRSVLQMQVCTVI